MQENRLILSLQSTVNREEDYIKYLKTIPNQSLIVKEMIISSEEYLSYYKKKLENLKLATA